MYFINRNKKRCHLGVFIAWFRLAWTSSHEHSFTCISENNQPYIGVAPTRIERSHRVGATPMCGYLLCWKFRLGLDGIALSNLDQDVTPNPAWHAPFAFRQPRP